MNITKILAGVKTAKDAVADAMGEQFAIGADKKADGAAKLAAFKGLNTLGRINEALDKASERIEKANTEKAKKVRKPKAAKA